MEKYSYEFEKVKSKNTKDGQNTSSSDPRGFSEKPKRKTDKERITIIIDENDINITHSLKQILFDKFYSLTNRYKKFLLQGELKAVFNRIGTQNGNFNPQTVHVECSLHFWTKVGNFNSSHSGRGITKVYSQAIDKLERQIEDFAQKVKDY